MINKKLDSHLFMNRDLIFYKKNNTISIRI